MAGRRAGKVCPDHKDGLARKVARVFSEEKVTDLGLRKQAKRLTAACMRSIYNNIEVNLDHLFAFALRAYAGRTIAPDDLRREIECVVMNENGAQDGALGFEVVRKRTFRSSYDCIGHEGETCR